MSAAPQRPARGRMETEMTTYSINTADGFFFARANLAEASAPIHTYFGDDIRTLLRDGEDYYGCSWQPTRFQTANACHRAAEMATLLAEEFDMGEVISVSAMD